MLVESICIILIFVLIRFDFLRRGRKDYAKAMTPLLVLPIVHTVFNVIGDIIKLPVNVNVKAAADVLALAVAIAYMAIVSIKLKTTKSRTAYLIVCGGFTTILTIIFIFNYYAGATV